MSAAYAVFGRGGYYIKPYSFTKVIFEDGTTYEKLKGRWKSGSDGNS